MRNPLYLIPLAALAFCLVLGGFALNDALGMRGRAFPGFLVQENGAVAPIRRSSWPGSRQGVQPGERVTTINGEPISSGRELQERIGHLSAGDSVRIGFANGRSGDFQLRTLTVGDFAATFILPFSVGLFYLLVGALIFSARRTYAAALLFSICIVAAAFHVTTFDAQTTYRFSRVWITYPLLGAVALHLFAAFPEPWPRMLRPLSLGLSYAIAVGLLIWRQSVHESAPASAAVSLGAAFYLAAAFLGCAALLFRARQHASSQTTRNKARVLLWGLFLTMAMAVAWGFVVRILPDVLTVERVMIASSFFPLLIAYAALKHDLFDMDAFLRATLTYGTAMALVAGVYLVLVAATGLAAARAGVVGTTAGAVVLTLVVASAFQPLRKRVERLVDRVFFRERMTVTEGLHGLAAELSRDRTVEAIATRALPRMCRVLQARGAALFSVDRKAGVFQPVAHWGELDAAVLDARPLLGDVVLPGAHLVIPLRAAAEVVGLLAFGPKPPPQVYTPGEVDALRDTTPALATAMRLALMLREQAARERFAALGEVAAIIIHEVKNPIGIIKVSLGTLKRRLQGDSVASELVDCMEQEVDRMNQTSVQMLHFARPQPSEIGECDLATVVRRTADRVGPQMRAAGVSIHIECNDAGATQADPIAMEHVLTNLLENARAAMPPGGGEVRLTLRPIRRALRRFIEMVIEDTGRGMDAETCARIFQPFFTTRPGGTGLGLAIVRQILDDHGATIEVRSTPGRGTRFTIELPTT